MFVITYLPPAVQLDPDYIPESTLQQLLTKPTFEEAMQFTQRLVERSEHTLQSMKVDYVRQSAHWSLKDTNGGLHSLSVVKGRE